MNSATVVHQLILWAALAVSIGTCIYLNLPAGLMVAAAGSSAGIALPSLRTGRQLSI